ncbi:MAG: OmpH family outer membrane protein [Myxococcaceae bacterium]
MRFLILTVGLLSSFVYADTKIGVVELERAVNEVGEGIAAKARLQDEFKKKQDLLDKKQAELKKLQDSLQSQSAVMKEEARQAKGMEFQQKVAEAQQMYGNMQQDMVKRQQEVMGDILKKMNPIVHDIAKKEGYTAILNKSEATVVYIQSGLDVTDTVIQRYNAAYPAATAKAKKK